MISWLQEGDDILELVFDKNLAGAMRQAKGRPAGKKTVSQGVVLYMRTDDSGKEPPRTRSESRTIETLWGTTLEGTGADIAPLLLCLSQGDLSGLSVPGMGPRKAEMLRLFRPEHEKWQSSFEKSLDSDWEAAQDTWNRLRTAKERGESVRIWVASNCPQEVCGLYYACTLLEKSTPISVVWLPPEARQYDGALVPTTGSGAFCPEELGEFAAKAVPLSDELRQTYQSRWRELEKENAPLRVMVNGRLMSAPIDFYDFALRTVLPAEETLMGEVIVKTLHLVPGVGDCHFHRRLLTMIDAGELQVTKPGDPARPYSDKIQRRK